MYVEPFETPLPASTAAVTPSRRAFRAWLDELGVGEDVSCELAIVFSELLANAVGASPETDEVNASAAVEDGTVVIEVANALAPCSVPVERWDFDDPLRAGGRGLMIVRAYTDLLEIDVGDDEIVVRCERRLRD